MSTPSEAVQAAELTPAVAALIAIHDAVEAAADRIVQALSQTAGGAD